MSACFRCLNDFFFFKSVPTVETHLLNCACNLTNPAASESVSQCAELVMRRWGAHRITTRFNLLFCYACVIDFVTWVPGIPCCPGGPGSPCGPWEIMEIVTAQLTLNTSLGVNICHHWLHICMCKASAQTQLMKWGFCFPGEDNRQVVLLIYLF